MVATAVTAAVTATTDQTNINDVALIFEGGGMRAAYTSGVVRVLLENKLYFADAYGISAGSSHAVNYISRDQRRDYLSFADYFSEPKTAGLFQFLIGHGYFNANYIYQVSGLPNGVLPFDFKRFMASPTDMHIDGYEVDTGRTVSWTKADIKNLKDLMTRVQASSSMPIFMPEVKLNGHVYLDGGLGDSWGILLDRAIKDGYKRFFIVCTQVKGYRKQPLKNQKAVKLLLRKHPNVVQRMIDRPSHYNELCDRLDELESTGKAYVYRPINMDIKNTTTNVEALCKASAEGYQQAFYELPYWKEFLGV